MKPIAILGTGPAGLMAAHAVALAGRPFSMFGLPDASGHVRPSVISGAQFMHVAVPTISDEDHPDFSITYRKTGTVDGYARKVYGDESVPFVSYANVEDGQVQPAWSLRSIYEQMWDGLAGGGSSVNAMRVDAKLVRDWVYRDEWDAIICTIPRNAICLTHAGLVDRTPHGFLSQEVNIVDSEDMGVGFNEIVYNGDPEQSWYRSSNIAGWQSTEWGAMGVPPYFQSRARTLQKPISHTCDCWKDDPVIFAGRYGKWEKGVLVQDGFIETFQAVERLRVNDEV